ncbi:MAG: putative phosphoserine phosphatase 2 [Pseudomonas citronellolis]|nr:MAG: putative phosphoserine phosphatase 2 [Pseudomonas citronellolis]
MSLRLRLISHARTDAQRFGRFPLDEALSGEDARELAQLAQRLGRPQRLYVGPELRCWQTAQAWGQAADVQSALRDCAYGAWAGKRLEEIEAGALGTWLGDAATPPPQGESFAELLRRVADWLDALQGDGRIVAISHPPVLRAALLHVLGLGAEAASRIDIDALSVLDLSFNGRWRLRL